MTMGTGGASDGAEDALWWYRDGSATCGPVSMTELKRLASGPLGSATLVWRKTFGDRWQSLEATLTGSDAVERPPSSDYGSWTRTFERFAADPKKNQLSWIGLFGPLAYFYLGMWRRAMILVAVSLAFQTLFAFADYGTAPRTHLVPAVVILWFCVRNLKRDYYRFKVLGEPMWPGFRVMSNGFACSAPAMALLILLCSVYATDPAETMIAAVDGVWQSDGANVVIDVAGDRKTITYGGGTHTVSLASVSDVNEVIVFRDVYHPERTITLAKHWTDAHDKYTFDLFVEDQFVANLAYLRPI